MGGAEGKWWEMGENEGKWGKLGEDHVLLAIGTQQSQGMQVLGLLGLRGSMLFEGRQWHVGSEGGQPIVCWTAVTCWI